MARVGPHVDQYVYQIGNFGSPNNPLGYGWAETSAHGDTEGQIVGTIHYILHQSYIMAPTGGYITLMFPSSVQKQSISAWKQFASDLDWSGFTYLQGNIKRLPIPNSGDGQVETWANIVTASPAPPPALKNSLQVYQGYLANYSYTNYPASRVLSRMQNDEVFRELWFMSGTVDVNSKYRLAKISGTQSEGDLDDNDATVYVRDGNAWLYPLSNRARYVATFRSYSEIP